MNSTQAKKIPIPSILPAPQSQKGADLWYLSPLHQEKTPSFKVNTQKNIWYDHGLGIGGNIIDLVMQLKNCNFQEALQHLDNDSSFSFSQAKKTLPPPGQKKTETTIKKIQNLQNEALLNYLKKRNLYNQKDKIEEIYYHQNNKNYFALAFKNDSGGYEVRNPYFKGCVGSKDITTIKSTDNTKLSIFEGFLDYLSALQHFKLDNFKSDVIVLNSLSNKSKIDITKYTKLYLFLDNDKAGEIAKQEFYTINKNCIDCSNIYKNFKDFNEFLSIKKI